MAEEYHRFNVGAFADELRLAFMAGQANPHLNAMQAHHCALAYVEGVQRRLGRPRSDRLAAWAPKAAALLRETVDGWDGGSVGAWTVEQWDRWVARVRALLAELEEAGNG